MYIAHSSRALHIRQCHFSVNRFSREMCCFQYTFRRHRKCIANAAGAARVEHITLQLLWTCVEMQLELISVTIHSIFAWLLLSQIPRFHVMQLSKRFIFFSPFSIQCECSLIIYFSLRHCEIHLLSGECFSYAPSQKLVQNLIFSFLFLTSQT